jgi:hypothetical protein
VEGPGRSLGGARGFDHSVHSPDAAAAGRVIHAEPLRPGHCPPTRGRGGGEGRIAPDGTGRLGGRVPPPPPLRKTPQLGPSHPCGPRGESGGSRRSPALGRPARSKHRDHVSPPSSGAPSPVNSPSRRVAPRTQRSAGRQVETGAARLSDEARPRTRRSMPGGDRWLPLQTGVAQFSHERRAPALAARCRRRSGVRIECPLADRRPPGAMFHVERRDQGS